MEILTAGATTIDDSNPFGLRVLSTPSILPPDLKNCLRTKPVQLDATTYHPDESLPTDIFYLLLIIGLVSCSCFLACSYLFYFSLKKCCDKDNEGRTNNSTFIHLTPDSPANSYVEMLSLDEASQYANTVDIEENNNINTYYNNNDYKYPSSKKGMTIQLGTSSFFDSNSTISTTWKKRCATACCLFPSGLVTLLIVLILIFYPHYPQYEICNTVTDWDSILHHLERFEAAVDYHIIMSIANPNPVAVNITDVNLKFVYDNTEVGSLVLDTSQKGGDRPYMLEKYAVTDVLAKVVLTPSVFTAWSMYSDYQSNNLIFQASGDVTTKILLSESFLIPVSYTFEKEKIHINAKEDDSLCKCRTNNTKLLL